MWALGLCVNELSEILKLDRRQSKRRAGRWKLRPSVFPGSSISGPYFEEKMSEKKCGGYIPCDNLQVKGAWRRLLARLDRLIVNVDIHTTARINQQSLITNHMLTCACKRRIHNFGMSDVQFSAFQAPAARRWWHVS